MTKPRGARPRGAVIGASLAMAAVASAMAGTLPDASTVSAEIGRVGGDAVVAGLTHQHQWDAFLRRVDTGQPGWVQVAGTLMHSQLGCASCSEALPISLAAALSRNPAAVLDVLTSDQDVSRVCSSPFIEPGPAFLASYRRDTERALGALQAPALAARRDACLAQLEHVKR